MMIDIKIDRRTLVSVSVGAVLIVAAVFLAGRCGREDKKQEMGPAQVVEQFCRAVAAGNFEEAGKLCMMDSMKDYINAYSALLNGISEKNGSAAAVAAGMLSEMEISISDVAKEGDRRLVFYYMSFEGLKKEKLATLVKEDGEWKVAAITDRN